MFVLFKYSWRPGYTGHRCQQSEAVFPYLPYCEGTQISKLR